MLTEKDCPKIGGKSIALLLYLFRRIPIFACAIRAYNRFCVLPIFAQNKRGNLGEGDGLRNGVCVPRGEEVEMGTSVASTKYNTSLLWQKKAKVHPSAPCRPRHGNRRENTTHRMNS